MRRPRSKTRITRAKPEWATTISELREHLNLSQTEFGQRLHTSAMAISRWERGAQEPPAGSYIELGNLAGDPLCWYFWGRAGLHNEDFMRVMPNLRKRLNRIMAIDFPMAAAGSGGKKTKDPQLIAIPLLKSWRRHLEKKETMLPYSRTRQLKV